MPLVPIGDITTLMDTVSGCYLVRTVSGSLHVLDLDAKTVTRIPDVQAPERELRRDDEDLRLLEILEATVGRELRLLLDLDLGVGVTLRRSTEVISIQQLAEESAA